MIWVTLIVGLLTIGVNIWITRSNAGKNRIIYEVNEAFTADGKTEQVNNLLKLGEYTVLFVGQNLSNRSELKYVLGRVQQIKNNS